MEETNHGDRKSASYWRHRYYPHYWWKRRYYPYYNYYYDDYPNDYYSWRRKYGSPDTNKSNGYNNSHANPTSLNFMGILQELFSLKVDAMTMIKLLQYSRDKQLSDDKIFEMVESMMEKYHSSGEMLDIDDIGMFDKESEAKARQADYHSQADYYHPKPVDGTDKDQTEPDEEPMPMPTPQAPDNK